LPHGALRAFEEHMLAVTDGAVDKRDGVGYERAEFLRAAEIIAIDAGKAERSGAEGLKDFVVLPDFTTEFFGEARRRQQIDHAQAGARDLVSVRRADAAFGRAELAFALLLFAYFI